MLPTLVFWLVLAGQGNATPPVSPKQGSQVLPWSDIETIYRFELARTKSRRAFLEETIATFEKDLKESPPLYTPEQAVRVRRNLDKWREQVQFMKRYEWELELWKQQREQNPGSETDEKALERLGALLKEWNAWQDAQERPTNVAPPPREKK